MSEPVPCPGPAESAPVPLPDERARRMERVGLAIVLLAVLALFLPALRCEFVHWDDHEYVTDNPLVAHPDLIRIFSLSTLTVSDWTPLVTVTHAAERALFGDGPMPVHAVNVALHLLSVGLLVGLLRRAGVGWLESLLAAFLFGVHPLQVESVAWASARKNLLCAVFGFAFLRAHLDGRPVRATVWIVLAMLSKGTAVSFPVIAAAATFLGLGRARGRAAWAWIGAWMLLAAARGWISSTSQADVVDRLGRYGLASRMATMGVVLATQMRQFVAPTDLAILYSHTGRSFSEPAVLAAWGVVLAVVGFAAWCARRDRTLAFAGALVVASLLPTLNVFPSPYFQADRYAHVAIAGIAVFAVAALRPLARVHRAVPAGAVLVWGLAVGAPATLGRIEVWRTNLGLWNDACLRAPDQGGAWSELGAALHAEGRVDEAVAALTRASQLPHAKMEATITILALALRDAGRAAESRDVLERLVAKRPQAAEALATLGAMRHEQGRREEGWKLMDEGLRLRPDWPQHPIFRAEAFLREGRTADARKAVETGPLTTANRDVCALLLAAADALDGRPEVAFARLRARWPASFRDADVWAGIGDRLLDLGHADPASAMYARCVDADPAVALSRYRLAVARDRSGDAAGAREAANAALERAGPGDAWVTDARQLAASH